MKIVKATRPPTMAVIVDTIVLGEVELAVGQSHPIKSRTDIVFAQEGMVGILPGTPCYPGMELTPAVATGMRVLAKVYVLAGQDVVRDGSIEEA